MKSGNDSKLPLCQQNQFLNDLVITKVRHKYLKNELKYRKIILKKSSEYKKNRKVHLITNVLVFLRNRNHQFTHTTISEKKLAKHSYKIYHFCVISLHYNIVLCHTAVIFW